MPKFEGNRGTKTILGNREHKKTNFRFLGNKPIYFRGTREKVVPPPPPPPGRASLMEDQARGEGGVTLYQLGAWDWLKMMAFTWLR